MWPLYVAAGWGLYEVAISRRRRLALAITLAGWAVAAPAGYAMMSSPRYGVQEYPELRSLATGRDARQLGYGDPVVTRAALARWIDDHVLARHRMLLLDSYQGAAIAAQVRPADQRWLIMTFDRRFRPALARPNGYAISYLLLPSPKVWPQDAINRARPRLWDGREPGFTLEKRFDAGPEFGLPEDWRLYRVGVRARTLP
jgi:hypothetical protein